MSDVLLRVLVVLVVLAMIVVALGLFVASAQEDRRRRDVERRFGRK